MNAQLDIHRTKVAKVYKRTTKTCINRDKARTETLRTLIQTSKIVSNFLTTAIII